MTTGDAAGGPGLRKVRLLCSLSVPRGAGIPAGVPVTVHLGVADVSLADAAAEPVAQVDVVVHEVEGLEGPYALDAVLGPGRHFAVSAHVDLAGDGVVSPGDLLTTARVVVPTDQDAVALDVPLTLVR